MKFVGNPGEAGGLLSEFVVLPEQSCFPVPVHLENELAVMAEPLSIAIWATKLAGETGNKSIGILGSGPIGLCVLLYLRYLGADRIYVTDKLDYRVRLAGESGARWSGNPDTSDIVSGILGEEPGGLDLVFDCCGMQEAMDQAVDLMAPGGRIIIVGIPEFDHWSIETDKTRRKELCFQNVRRQNDCLQEAIDLIAGGKLDVSSLVTHSFPFGETGTAYDLVSAYREGVVKAIIHL
jgi:L-iditol 2-dehydrogenase